MSPRVNVVLLVSICVAMACNLVSLYRIERLQRANADLRAAFSPPPPCRDGMALEPGQSCSLAVPFPPRSPTRLFQGRDGHA